MFRSPALTPFDAARAFAEAIRSRAWLLAAVPLTVLAVVAGGRYVSGTDYEAEAVLAFDPLDRNRVLISAGVPAEPPPSEVELVSDGVLKDLARRLGGGQSAGDLRGRLSVPAADEREARLVAEGDSPDAAHRLAGAWAASVTAGRRARLKQQLEGAREATEAAIDAIDPLSESEAPKREALLDQLASITAAEAATRGDTEVARTPRLLARDSPWGEFAVLAVIGLVAGLVLAILLALVDRRLRTPEAMAAAFGVPLLGRLRLRGGSSSGGGSPTARLHGRLLIASGGQELPTLLVASADSRTDAVPAAYAVAMAVADTGKQVGLLLWRPGSLGSAARPPEALRQEWGFEVVHDNSQWPNVLGNLGKMTMRNDVAIVCTPPLPDTPEALVAAEAVAGWIVCASLGRTRLDDAMALRREIERAGKPPAGVLALADQPDEGPDARGSGDAEPERAQASSARGRARSADARRARPRGGGARL